MNDGKKYYIGLDIGGTKCAATLGSVCADELTVIFKNKFFTGDLDPYEVLDRFALFIDERLKTYPVSGIGISCGGPLDGKRGIIMSPPNLPRWNNIEIVRFFEEKYGIKTYLQNDANACAVAEWKFGAGKGAENIVFLTFGTGFGAGFILNGKLYSGANDNAGEVGHVRLTQTGPEGYGKVGSCEGYCSGSGMARLAEIVAKKDKFKNSFIDFLRCIGEEKLSAQNMAEYARKDNAFCKEIFKISGKMLGRTLSIIIDLLNPEKIIIGGIYMRAEDLLYSHAVSVMEKECLPFSLHKTEIVPARLGESIGDYAALSIAKGDF